MMLLGLIIAGLMALVLLNAGAMVLVASWLGSRPLGRLPAARRATLPPEVQ